ncbi:MAG: methylase [Acidobacteria bacterium]|nr:MAG: methylase [Acidobacteriota bacterium]
MGTNLKLEAQDARGKLACSQTYKNIYENGVYLEKNPLWHAEESPWKANQILRMIENHHLRPRTVCEVGCGAGEVLMQLHDRMNCDCSFWGYENSPQAFEMCKPKATERLQFRLGDIRDAEDRPFDLMLVLDVIEHLEDYFGLLRDLRPRSQHTIFHIPLDLSVQTVLRKGALLKRRDLHAHLHYFTKETALQTLRDTGYELQDFFYTPRSVELGTEFIQKALKLPRMICFAIHQDLAARVLGGYSLLVLAK